ncbi:MAG: carboxypeptidase regulatory-like domain-containing protein [Bacteroidales bacterium]|nr:carboxypeptidase regulatory-like domain-containing protein [Bacteroidales bacterium]
MKTTRLLISFLLLLCTSLSARDRVQDRFSWQNKIMPQEKVHLMTDRNIYIGGDTIWLRPFIVDGLTMKPALFSRFLYVELLSQTDSLVYRAKLHQQPERDDNTMRGYIPLDITMPTGIYTLVAYTRWMLNGDEQHFFKRNVQVINARDLDNGVLPALLTKTTNEDAYHSIDKTELLKADYNPHVYRPEIKTEKESYGQRDFVEVRFQAPANTVLAASVTDDSAAPIDPSNAIHYELFGQTFLHNIKDMEAGKVIYPKLQPEEFEIITGRVKSTMRGRIKPGIEVSLIAPAQGFVDEQVTDEQGMFTFDGFDLPDGTKFFLRSHDEAGKDVGEIELLPELFAKDVHHLEAAQSEAAASTFYSDLKTRMKYNNGQWEVLLNEIDVVGRTREQIDLAGKNAYTRLDHSKVAEYKDYTFETLLNAIPGVTIRDNQPYFRNAPLLIMIDDGLLQPSFSMKMTEYLNQICPPYYVDYIDVVNTTMLPTVPRVIGPFGGAAGGQDRYLRTNNYCLRIFTLKEIPNVGQESLVKEFTPLGHQHPREFNNGIYQGPTTPNGTDQRVTLYWNPHLVVDADGQCTFRFWTNDAQGTTYTIRVEGVSEDGNIISSQKTIRIN